MTRAESLAKLNAARRETSQTAAVIQSSGHLVRRIESHGPETLKSSKVQESSSAFPIDFVYCWAGETKQHDGIGEKLSDVDSDMSPSGVPLSHSGEGFGEMRYSLRFLEAYAPWFNKAYILVDSPVVRPAWLTEASKDKIVMIDRCKLFDRPEDCPTNNTAACESIAHRVPDLSEHYVMIQDDYLVVQPVQPSDFFTSDGRPLILAEGAEKEHQMYLSTPQGPDMPPASRPTRMRNVRHLPVPMLRRFAENVEHTYREWFAFVRSHRTRFVCCDAKKSSSGESAVDEVFSRVYPHLLSKESVGVDRPINYRTRCFLTDNGQDSFHTCIESKMDDPKKKFVTIQNVREVATWRTLQAHMEEHVKDMPKSEFVTLSS